MVKLELKVDFDPVKRHVNISGIMMAFHCHHYNTNLFQTLADIEYVDGLEILRKATENVVHAQFTQIYKDQGGISFADKMSLGEQLYKAFGFGILSLGDLKEDGGSFSSPSSHLVKGWLSKFGKRKETLCSYTCGFVAGIMAAATGNPTGTYKVKETQCMVTGASGCQFEVSK